jgi:hypothetical protein
LVSFWGANPKPGVLVVKRLLDIHLVGFVEEHFSLRKKTDQSSVKCAATPGLFATAPTVVIKSTATFSIIGCFDNLKVGTKNGLVPFFAPVLIHPEN